MTGFQTISSDSDRLTVQFNNAIEWQTPSTKQFCTAAFLDVSQAFDKVWHPGLLYKIKKKFSPQGISTY